MSCHQTVDGHHHDGLALFTFHAWTLLSYFAQAPEGWDAHVAHLQAVCSDLPRVSGALALRSKAPRWSAWQNLHTLEFEGDGTRVGGWVAKEGGMDPLGKGGLRGQAGVSA
jgi:hypothetical protein